MTCLFIYKLYYVIINNIYILILLRGKPLIPIKMLQISDSKEERSIKTKMASLREKEQKREDIVFLCC